MSRESKQASLPKKLFYPFLLFLFVFSFSLMSFSSEAFAGNTAPTAVDDTASVKKNSWYRTIDVLANDIDSDGDNLRIVKVTQPPHGEVLRVHHNKAVIYRPDRNFTGTDTFTYKISDRRGGKDTATVNVTVYPDNNPPVANDDTKEVRKNSWWKFINVLGNDSDPDEDFLRIISVTQPAHGRARIGFFKSAVYYKPVRNYEGPDSFTYTISDGGGGTATATVYINPVQDNDPPDAADDSTTVDEDSGANLINALTNDTDPDGDTLGISGITQGAHGTVVNNSTNVTYEPNLNFNGSDSFTYTISDGKGGTDTATVNVTINPVNDAPNANNDTANVNEGSGANPINVLSNDTDVEGDTLTITGVTQGGHGAVVNNGTNVTYEPAAGYDGSDSFTYTISDGNGGTDTATVNVTVTAVNQAPDAVDDTASVDEDSGVNTIDVLINDTDTEGDTLTITDVTQGAHGAVVNNGTNVTYEPAAGYFGSDSFTYTISDGNGGIDTATVNVTVEAVNDAPDAVDDLASVDEDSGVNTIDVLINDTDAESDTLTITDVTQGTHGAVVNDTTDVTYEPDDNYYGSDSFTYTISDGNGGEDTATVNVTVESVNDAPDAVDDTESVNKDSGVNMIDVLDNDTDVESDTLTITDVTQGTHGAVVNNTTDVTYEPDAGYTGTDSFTYTVSDGNSGEDTATVTITVVNPDLPPDPATVAPPLDPTTTTGFRGSTEFLYTGTTPIQTGVTSGTIEEKRAAVIRGKVLKRDGSALSGVTISILDHPEFGQTLSRIDGLFDMAVNGGGSLTVNYELTGYLPAQRKVDVPWNDFIFADDVVMIPLDPAVTVIDLNSPSLQVARGSVVTDDDGTRRATLMFHAGNSALLHFPGGSSSLITSFNIRATEYTVGESGPDAMPAPLPPSSSYTYAAEFSLDEAIATDAEYVTFEDPFYGYIENFIGFETGTPVPAAYYDKVKGAWMPSDDGVVIEILSITSGAADVDTTGDGIADNGILIDMTIEERTTLASLYSVGQTLWRTPVQHLSPTDWNYPPPTEFPDGAKRPDVKSPDNRNDLDNPSTEDDYGMLDLHNQAFRESAGINGTPFTLNYSSQRVPGNTEARTLNIQLMGDTLPTVPPKRIIVSISIAGKRAWYFYSTVTTNMDHTFVWDGKDVYGREVRGRYPAVVRITYVFDGYYSVPAAVAPSFGWPSGNEPTVQIPARREKSMGTNYKTTLDSSKLWFAKNQGVGGWTLNVHHSYDPQGQVLHLGNGTMYSADNVMNTFHRIAGIGNNTSQSGDGGPALDAGLASPEGVCSGPDGSIYISDGNMIRKITHDGIINRIAGQEDYGYSGDDGPAILAELNEPRGLDIGPDGSLYIADSGNNVIRKITPDGIIHTVAGYYDDGGYGMYLDGKPDSLYAKNEKCGLFLKFFLKLKSFLNVSEAVAAGGGGGGDIGDGGPAVDATLDTPYDVKVTDDGTMYICEYGGNRIRRVGPSGIIHTVAGGSDTPAYPDEWVPATDADLFAPRSIALGPDGSIYIADQENNRVKRVTPGGIIYTVAGDGSYASDGDGGPAVDAGVYDPMSVVVTEDGVLYISEQSGKKIRKVDTNGIITTLAGGGTYHLKDVDGAPAASINMGDEGIVNMSLSPDGSLLCAFFQSFSYYPSNDTLYKVKFNELPEGNAGEIVVPNKKGTGIYVFDATGRHLETRNALTNATVLSFGYDTEGRLTTITDADGKVTTVVRDGSGEPEKIIAPFGQETVFSLDANGYLETIENPAGERLIFDYTDKGLLTSMTRPKGNEYTFTYNSEGALEKADKPDGGFTELNRTVIENGYEVSQTTAEGRVTTHRVQRLATGEIQFTKIDPANVQQQSMIKTDGTLEVTLSDGTLLSLSSGPDPRYLMQAPIMTKVVRTSPDGLVTTITRERTVTLTDPEDITTLETLTDTFSINGRNFVWSFDRATNTWTTTSPTGKQSSREIDEFGRIIGYLLSNGTPYALSYDANGLLESFTEGAGGDTRTASFGYNADGYMERMTDPELRETLYNYTPSGKIGRITYPDISFTVMGYDLNGNMDSITPPEKPAHTFTHTVVDLAEQVISPLIGAGTDKTVFAYNLDRQVISITRPDGVVYSFNYDTAGRTKSIVTPTETITHTYDPVSGHINSIATAGGESIAFDYDGNLPKQITMEGTVAAVIEPVFDNNLHMTSLGINGVPVEYGYDADGFIDQAGELSLTRDASGLTTETSIGNVSDLTGYNAFMEITSYSAVYSGTDIFSASYTRDKLGRLTQKVETVEGAPTTYDYAYDLKGRLDEVWIGGVLVAEYTYDANGNRLSLLDGLGTHSGTYDDQDRMNTYDGAVYTYSDNGELASKTVGTDVTTYQYDVLGNLKNVVFPDMTAIDYIVDGKNRRIAKKVGGMVEQKFLYAGQLHPIAELDAANNVVSRFIYGREMHSPDYMIQGANTYRFVCDNTGSVRLVINADTGAIAQRLDYDEFGRVINDTNPGFQPFGFASGIYDIHTGFVHFDRRDYDPVSGRWTTKDPIRFTSGDTNFYAYCENDPVNNIDPAGLENTTAKNINTMKTVAGVEMGLIKKGIDSGLLTSPETAGNMAKVSNVLDKGGKVLQGVNLVQSFVKYVDTANAYYYDGKGTAGDVFHDMGKFYNNVLGLFPGAPKVASSIIGGIDAVSKPVLNKVMTDYYVNQANNTAFGSSSSAPTPGVSAPTSGPIGIAPAAM